MKVQVIFFGGVGNVRHLGSEVIVEFPVLPHAFCRFLAS